MAETPFERAAGRAWQAPPVVRARAMLLWWPVTLALILLLGGYLRFHDLRWDQPAGASAPLQMHPDERFLSFVADRVDWPSDASGYFDTARSPLNPYNTPDTHSFVYGTFPLFLAKAVSTIAGDDPSGPNNSYDKTVVWGRRLTALFDTATIALVFGLGTVLAGKRAGLAAALLYALSVLPTQLAHFWTMDPYVVFFATATLLLSALAVRPPRRVSSGVLLAAAGVTVGLGLASKVTALPILLSPLVAVMVRVGLRDLTRLGLTWRGKRGDSPGARITGHWTSDVSAVCVSLALAIVVFRVAQPYAWTGPHFWDMSISDYWWSDIQRERDFQNGNVDYPPFVQFAGRTPFLTPLRHIVLFGLGPALGVAAIVSLVAAAVVMFRRRELVFLLPLVFAAAVFGFQGPRFVAFMRYFVPLYPVLCLFAAWGLLELWRAAGNWRASKFTLELARWRYDLPHVSRLHMRWAAGGVIALVFGATIWWAAAFQAVYNEEHPRVAASQWIYDNVPPGSGITAEIWDDSLPYGFGGRSAGLYRFVELELYLPDTPQKIRELVYGRPGTPPKLGLNNADYVAISSNRVRDSIPRLEREYPATARYYELLDSGELGFELVKTFTLHPTFLGISIDDTSADESFTVYDHPEVRIYRKTAAWDPAKALALLNEAHPERALNLLPRQGGTNGLQFTAEEAAVQQAGGTFSDAFDRDGPASHLPWLWWLAWLELAAFAAIPWVTWLFRALPDRGYGLSKLCGFAAVVLATWLATAWGAADFSWGLCWTAFTAAMVAGVVLGYARRDTIRADFREHWVSWAAMEAVFLLAFAGFLMLRYANPDLWHHPQGGEKPIELAYLTAVARSTHMPPYDPWFAGGTMNYYYMGWFFIAVPMRALRLLPEVGFNLAVPTFAALGATTAASTVHNLVALRPGGGMSLPSRRTLVLMAFLGAFLLVGVANLDGAHQTIERFQYLNVITDDRAGHATYHWSLFSDTPFLGGAVGFFSGVYRSIFEGAPLPPFDWWRSSRVHMGSIDITEFPYWSLLFADLHPHLMGVPFFGLIIALGVTYTATASDGHRARCWFLALAMGLALGLERTVHTWDFPTAVLLTTGAIALGQLVAPGRWQQRWWDFAGHAVLAAAVLTVVFAPYTAHFEVFNSGIQRAKETTKANQYFAHFGLFVVFALAFIAVRYREEQVARAGAGGRNPFLALTRGPWELGALALFVTGLTVFTWRYDWTVMVLSGVILLFLANLAWLDWRRQPRDLARLLVTVLYAAAFGVAAGVDVVTVKNDIERMNTVFKFSLQAWQLFALASAYAGWYVTTRLRASGAEALAGSRTRLAATWAWGITAAALLFGASIFLISGTNARQEARFADLPWTLDGFAYQQRAVFVEDLGTPDPADDRTLKLADDTALIWWLRDNVQGSPVIVEAVGNLYHWTGRISSNTGLPAVIGWDWHQIQQRWDYTALVQLRRGETQRFYHDSDTIAAAQFLQKYDVRYVVVGGAERATGTPAGIQKFQKMEALTPVYTHGDDVIYRVDQAKLTATLTPGAVR
ncbi:MAG: glycosyltransferase family 39 protein [Chloroflexi bacterium]|nr:glycosyltransferase family 39 protein [Chloroflexota bacterium]